MNTEIQYRELTLALNRDYEHACSFRVAVKNYKGQMTHVDCVLRRDQIVKGDGIYWGLNSGTVIASSYSDKEVTERKRLQNSKHLQDGEVVEIDGGLYTAKVNGQYVNAVTFVPVAA